MEKTIAQLEAELAAIRARNTEMAAQYGNEMVQEYNWNHPDNLETYPEN